MTIVDLSDLRARACPECGAVTWNHLRHREWHERIDGALRHVRNICAGMEEETHDLRALLDLIERAVMESG